MGSTSLSTQAPQTLAKKNIQSAQPPTTIRSFSDDSHGDFAPQKKKLESDGIAEAVEMIDQHVKDNPVMLYMKGNPSMPMCGFSAKIVQMLQAEGADFSSVNVLDYPSIREGVKQYASWPTM
jgi:monothiol glutaredoxin